MATIVQPPFYVPSPPEDQPWVAQAYQFESNTLQKLSASSLLFQRADQVRKHHNYDDSSAWNASPINANTLQMLAYKPTSPAKTWAQWQHLDDPPVWSGSPLNSGAITATRTQIKIYGQPGQVQAKDWATNQHYDETGPWDARPLGSWRLIDLVGTALKFYGAPGQVPTKDWPLQYTQDDPAFWMGNPLTAYALVNQPAPTPKVPVFWKYDYDDAAPWLAQSVNNWMTRYPFPVPRRTTPLNAAFTEDIDDAAFWQGNPTGYVLRLIGASTARIPREWRYDYDELGVWEQQHFNSRVIYLPLPPAAVPDFQNFSPFTYDDGTFYVAQSSQFNADILQQLFLAGQRATKQWSEWQTIDDHAIYVAQSSQFTANILKILSQAGSQAGQPPTKSWELSYDYDDPGVWNEFAAPRSSPLLRPLLTVGGQSPTMQWSEWQTQDDPAFWSGTPLTSAVLSILLTAGGRPASALWTWDFDDAGVWYPQPKALNLLSRPPQEPFTAPVWKFDYDETGVWMEKPITIAVLNQLLAANVPKKDFFWKYDYDDAASWLAAPKRSVLLTGMLTVGGQPPTKRWEGAYDYDDPGPWNEFAAPRSSPLLRPLLTSGIPFVPRFWRQDHDDAAPWLSSPFKSWVLSTTIPTAKPFVPVIWKQDYDDTIGWLAQSRAFSPLLTALAGPFQPRFWRFDYDDPGPWPWAPVTSLSALQRIFLIQTGVKPFGKQWEFHDDDSASWSIVSRGIPPMVRSLTQGGQPPTRRWEPVSDYDDPGPWNEFAAPRSSAVLRPLLTALTPFHKLWTWDFDEGGLWTPKIPTNLQLINPTLPIGTPIFSKLGQFTQDDGATWLASPLPSRTLDPLLKAVGQPPTIRWEPLQRYDVDAAAWEATRRENLTLLTTPVPNPIIPRQWRWDYMIDEPLWQKGPTSAWIDQLIAPPPPPVNIDQLRLNSSTRVRSLSILGQRVRLIAGVPNTRQVT